MSNVKEVSKVQVQDKMSNEEFSEFLVDAVNAGYEAKNIDGVLRLKRYQRKDGTAFVNEIKMNPENFHLELVMKKDGKIEVQSSGSVREWSNPESETKDFDEKIQFIMKTAISRASQIAKLQSMDDAAFNALIEKAESMKKITKKN